MTALLDDHLLRDWMTGPDRTLGAILGTESLATTNLWYARLCKSAARVDSRAILGTLSRVERAAIVAALVRLPDVITIVPMRQLAWRMGVLMSTESGLSTLGAEAVAAAEVLSAHVLVSNRDDSPGIRRSCETLGIPYASIRVRGTRQ